MKEAGYKKDGHESLQGAKYWASISSVRNIHEIFGLRMSQTTNVYMPASEGARVESEFWKLPRSARELMGILMCLGEGWIDRRHFTLARKDEWARKVVETGVANGYPEVLWGPDSEGLFDSAVNVLVERGFMQVEGEEGRFLRLTGGMIYNEGGRDWIEDEYFYTAYAIFLVGTGVGEDMGIENIEVRMEACLDRALRVGPDAERVIGKEGWEFLRVGMFVLGDGFAGRERYDEAKALYELSIGSDRDGDSWSQRISVAMIEGFVRKEWGAAKKGIEDAISRSGWSRNRWEDVDDMIEDFEIFMTIGRKYMRRFPEEGPGWQKLVEFVDGQMNGWEGVWIFG